MATSGYKSISRIDSELKNMHGWYVRVYFNGEIHARYFSDARYDSAEHALEEAINFRNETEAALGKPRTERPVVTTNPRNRSGVLGVHRTLKESLTRTGKKSVSEVYAVTWAPEPNVVQRTSVSIEKYGEEEAFRRACEIRRKKEREIYGQEVQDFTFD